VGIQRAILFILFFCVRFQVHLHVFRNWQFGREIASWSVRNRKTLMKISELLWFFMVVMNMIEFTQLVQIGIVGRYKFPLGFGMATFAINCFVWVFIPVDPVEFKIQKWKIEMKTLSNAEKNETPSAEEFKQELNRMTYLLVLYICGFLFSVLTMYHPFVILMLFSPVLLLIVYLLYADLTNPSLYVQNTWLRKNLPNGDIVDRFKPNDIVVQKEEMNSNVPQDTSIPIESFSIINENKSD
jgi:hypothetical protein